MPFHIKGEAECWNALGCGRGQGGGKVINALSHKTAISAFVLTKPLVVFTPQLMLSPDFPFFSFFVYLCFQIAAIFNYTVLTHHCFSTALICLSSNPQSTVYSSIVYR